MEKIRIIVSGGGTGGHIYPAVATVEALEKKLGKENIEVLFVGAEGKMEMQRVPALGYRIVGLPVVGLQRRLTLKNLQVPVKTVRGLLQARRVLKEFRPDVVAGFGGYASLPLLWQAQRMHLPTVIWEGNSYAGMANRILAKGASRVCVSYDRMSRFFPESKIVKTGNPVRGVFGATPRKSPEALGYFGLDGSRPVLLLTGGSLGARAINESVLRYLDRIVDRREVDLIWQVGSYYYESIRHRLQSCGASNIWYDAFIDRMDYAYAAADLVVCRSGASTVTEVSLSGTPALFIPSSNVAEDHQTKNAATLVEAEAAAMLTDATAVEEMFPSAMQLLSDPQKLAAMAGRMKDFARPDAADAVAEALLAQIKKEC